ncbi:unnamed protein product [Hymenolepis diminuta]|uniref:Uncharacterized protein n=1 Tax=Hymenolepis diminuta TaxID=6216 RepID=A0A564Z3T4_HYMDI|nr:unnamed protein product [Hymenolepis diminuta]
MSSYADGEFLGEYVPSDYLRKKYLTVRPPCQPVIPNQALYRTLDEIDSAVKLSACKRRVRRRK